MVEKEILIQNVRAAIGDRAQYLALLVRSFSTALPKDEVVRLARKAIHEYGLLKGKADQQVMTPEKWIKHFSECGGADLFEGSVLVGENQSEQRMTYCPLMAGWKAMGCSEEEMDLLCDIAMEVDRGRADFHNIPYEINQRIASGDSFCRLVLKNG